MPQLSGDTLKLLLVGIIERVCQKTIVREIPGIRDCFSSKETIKGKNGGASREITKVSSMAPRDDIYNSFADHDKWFQLSRNVAVRQGL